MTDKTKNQIAHEIPAMLVRALIRQAELGEWVVKTENDGDWWIKVTSTLKDAPTNLLNLRVVSTEIHEDAPPEAHDIEGGVNFIVLKPIV